MGGGAAACGERKETSASDKELRSSTSLSRRIRGRDESRRRLLQKSPLTSDKMWFSVLRRELEGGTCLGRTGARSGGVAIKAVTSGHQFGATSQSTPQIRLAEEVLTKGKSALPNHAGLQSLTGNQCFQPPRPCRTAVLKCSGQP